MRQRYSMLIPGFSLIDIVTALAVVAILSALAYPTYMGAMRRGRRLDAMAALTRIQLAQEAYRAVHPRYARHLTQLGWPTDTPLSAEGFYRLQLPGKDGPSRGFVAWAEPTAKRGQNLDRCRRFVLDQDGPDLQHTTAPECWRR